MYLSSVQFNRTHYVSFLCTYSSTTPTNFAVTVHEYTGSLHTLSLSDLDQLLINGRLEETTVSIDHTLNQLLEVDMAASTTRAQRDLGEKVPYTRQL